MFVIGQSLCWASSADFRLHSTYLPFRLGHQVQSLTGADVHLMVVVCRVIFCSTAIQEGLRGLDACATFGFGFRLGLPCSTIVSVLRTPPLI
jgi:hypothetical protein